MDISKELKRIAGLMALEDDGYNYISHVDNYQKGLDNLDTELRRIDGGIDIIKQAQTELTNAVSKGNVEGMFGVNESIEYIRNSLEVIVHASRAIDQTLSYISNQAEEIQKNRMS